MERKYFQTFSAFVTLIILITACSQPAPIATATPITPTPTVVPIVPAPTETTTELI